MTTTAVDSKNTLFKKTPLADYNPEQVFQEALKLVNLPFEAAVQDEEAEVIYNKTIDDENKLIISRKAHSSGLYEYHVCGVFPASI